MKNYWYPLSLIFLLVACSKKEDTVYPFTDKYWEEPEKLHLPDNLGAYTYVLGNYQFKADGTYRATDGANIVEAKWYWLVEGEKFKIDYEGVRPFNEIFTILAMSDTLLHVEMRLEGEPENTGNYWELKYRPHLTTCAETLESLNGKVLFSNSGVFHGGNYTTGQATLSTDFIQKMDISIKSAALDTVLHYTYTCSEVTGSFGNIPVLKIFNTDGVEVTQPRTLLYPKGAFECKLGALDYLFAL